MRARSRLFTAFAFVGIASATACSAVLGFDELTPYPTEAGVDSATPVGDAPTSPTDAVTPPIDTGGSPTDAGEDSTLPVSDGSTTDAPTDAPADAPTDAPACVADFTKDPKHCGRCNHDCVGGACTNSVCEPLLLADGLADPTGLTTDATYVYVGEKYENRISRFGKDQRSICLVAPLPPQCVFIDQPNTYQPTSLSSDGTRLYWVNDNSEPEIRTCPLSGCGSQAATVIAKLTTGAFDHIFSTGFMPLELVIRDGLVFWAEGGTGAIRSAEADGGALRDGGSLTTYFENTSFMPLAVAVDQTNIYFTDETSQHQTQIASVRRDGSNKDGGSVSVVTPTAARPYGLALSKNDLYWTIPTTGGVQAAPTNSDGGGPIRPITNGALDPYMIIADDTNVYWLAPGANNVETGMVLTCPLTGCPPSGPIILANKQRRPRHLAQDEKAIYWSNFGLQGSVTFDGQVVKVAKP